MDYDLLIRGGTLVDGTGRERVRGDLGIKNGRIVAVGDVKGDATETLDAGDLMVAPGFVDIHTHYDAQVMWDRGLSPSPWHGVTTAVLGNCGFGIAPMRPEHRDVAMRTLEKVEGMSYESLKAGLGEEWPFQTFPQYLDQIASGGTAVNVAAYVGHTPVRLNVMGEDATERAATPEELDAMRRIVREAVQAGALGFSTSYAATHHGAGGKPVPSRLATFGEIDALVAEATAAGSRIMQAACGKGLFNEEFEDLAKRHEIAITWTALLAGMTGPGSHRRYLDIAERHAAEGIRVVPQVACRPIMFDFHFAEPYPFELLPSFKASMGGTREDKLRDYRDPSFRARFKEDTADSAKNVCAGWAERAVVSVYLPDRSLEERSLADLARERNVDPVDLALDMSLETDLTARFRFAFLNHDQTEVRELIRDPNTVITLSDAGAHADQLCDACYGTHLLGHWVREEGALELETAIHALTSRPAELVGIRDRGRLETGLAADIVVFDPKTVGHAPLRRVSDSPGGAERLVADELGLETVIVNGAVIRRGGKDALTAESDLPGHLLRGGVAPEA